MKKLLLICLTAIFSSAVIAQNGDSSASSKQNDELILFRAE